MSLLNVNLNNSQPSDSDATRSKKSSQISSDPSSLASNDASIAKESHELSVSITKQSGQPSIFSENQDSEEAHNVSITVTICAAFPAEDVKEIVQESSTNKPRATEGPKPQNFYRFEYQLMPDDPEPIQADLVTYKIAAKLFPEKSEPRIIKSWEHDDQIWIIWSQTHELQLTKSRLLKLFEHEIVLKIWDSRDFCSARTKFDKPKPFKFAKTASEADSRSASKCKSRNAMSSDSEVSCDQVEENVKRMVLDNCDTFLKQIPKELHSRLERKLPNMARIEVSEPVNNFETIEKLTNTLVAVPVRSANKNMNKLADLALDTEMVKSIKHLRNSEKNRPKSNRAAKESQFGKLSSRKSNRQSNNREKTKKEMAAEQDYIKKNGVARLQLRMKILFSGESYIAARITETTPTIGDCILSVQLENSLMSDDQLYDLNPMTIKVEKLTNMPNKPVPFNELKENCLPVYCSYQFFKQPLYRTESLVHSTNLFYYDINVFLLGLLDIQELHEFLHSSSFEIEVHDRDRKPVTKETLKACLFGNDINDENISSTTTAASKHTRHNPFDVQLKNWDPYGIARLNLHDLVMGKKLVEFFVPVLPCMAPDVLGRSVGKATQKSKKIDSENAPIQAGHFLDCNTHLNVKITTAKPVFHAKAVGNQDIEQSCAFGRIILRLDSTKRNVIITLKDTIKQINAEALGLDKYPIKVQEAAMSTQKLNNEQQTSKNFNLISGFHLISGKNHLFILEGLKDVGIKRIFNLINPSKNDNSIEVIYNSEMAFSRRLYGSLEIDLMTIKLFEPLEEIVKKPLLYIRDMTPKDSFDALVKINQVMIENRLRSVIRCDLLPTCDMVQSMSKEFGVPISQSDEETFKSSSSIGTIKQQDSISEVNLINDNENYGYEKVSKIPHTSRIWTPIDNENEQYMRDKLEKQSLNKSFLLNNIQNIQEASDYNKLNKPIKNYIIADNFSYSSSTRNSTEIALNKFRDYVKQTEPNQLYSFNPDSEYSATFVPVNIKRLEVEEKQKSIDKWRSTEGWIYPDVKTTLQSNQHPKRLDQPAIESLNEPWEENRLNTHKLKSPCERIFYKGKMRQNDFDVWTKPKPENKLPVTIFEAGAIKENLEREVQQKEYNTWKNKLIVENTAMKFYKMSASTENKIDGPGSSTQLDKLQGVLKSEPVKKSLLVGGVNFNKIPALSVLKTSYDDQENFCALSKGFVAGNSMQMRITDDTNKIPVFDYQHAKFERIKGNDFDIVKQPHSSLYKRKIRPERDNQRSASRDLFNEQHSLYIVPNQKSMDYMERMNRINQSNLNWQLASFT